jgi:hypothetical protein
MTTNKVWCGGITLDAGVCSECAVIRSSERVSEKAGHPEPPTPGDAPNDRIPRSTGHCDALFEIMPGRWACRQCILDPTRSISVVDRRGDVLTGDRIARELDSAVSIATHLTIADCANEITSDGGIELKITSSAPPAPLPLPGDYSHVLAILDCCAHADPEFAVALTELRSTYERAACFTPAQTLLCQWRLTKNGIGHDPGSFVVSIRSDKEIKQLRSFDHWRKQKIAPYLSWQQRGRYGF